MKRRQLLDELKTVRAQTTTLLAELTEPQLEAPGALDDWSVREILAHITAWEVDVLTNLGKVKRGAKPGTTAWTGKTIQAQTERWHADQKDRPLASVMADFDGARRQMLRLLEAMSDAEAEAPVKWLQHRTLVAYVASQTVEHEAEHLHHLTAWRDRQTGTSTNGRE